MDTTDIVWLVLVALVLVAAVLLLLAARRRRQSTQLRDRFGPEYERTVDRTDSRRDAEQELRERAEERDRLDIRPLDPVRREGYAARWRTVQEDFVDRPAQAVTEAQSLVTEVMDARGYPTGDVDQSVRTVSVDHADVVEEYRAAHRISELNDRGEADTEQQRQAMVHYRALFGRLLQDGQDRPADPYPPSATDQRERERR